MIHPNMATMLAFVTCDAGVDPQWWQQALQAAVDGSFNAVTVDGDTSTNDTVLAFAAGPPLPTEHLPHLAQGLELLCSGLAKAVAPRRGGGHVSAGGEGERHRHHCRGPHHGPHHL